MSARTTRELGEESAAWRASSAGELREWAALMAAKAEAAQRAADLLEPDARKRRRRRSGRRK